MRKFICNFFRFRNENFDEGKYSKDYNKSILTELAMRKNSYPGIQEITFPVFRIKDDYSDLYNHTHFMPWGNILLAQQYVLSEGDKFDIETMSIISFNKTYYSFIIKI